MQAIPLSAALAGLAKIPQFFVWRLSWNAEKGKYDKAPCASMGSVYPMDASVPSAWSTFEQAEFCAVTWRAQDQSPGVGYTLGFWMTADCPYWFLDIDKCITNGQYNAIALELLAKLPGAFVEFSASGTGLHIIGHGSLSDHDLHRKKNELNNLELYAAHRGIAFGTGGLAYGNADTQLLAPILEVRGAHFPLKPAMSGEVGASGPRADWAGPVDDEDLLRRAMASRSLKAKAGHGVCFADLWEGRKEVLERFYGSAEGNEADAALASHLAFWTGCDVERMARLMWRSGLVRPKWSEHRTYLKELTIVNACAHQVDVCKDAPRVDVAAQMYGMATATTDPAPLPLPLPHIPTVIGERIPQELKDRIDALLDMVSASTDWADVHNSVIPAIVAANIPPALMGILEIAVNKRLDVWDAKLPMGKLRALLNPPRMTVEDHESGKPSWVGEHVYVTQGDKFFNLTRAEDYSRTSFNAIYDREMPMREKGTQREDATLWALQRWNIATVSDLMYYPGKPAIVEHDGKTWGNLYSSVTIPPTAVGYTEPGSAAIGSFMRHMWLICSQRKHVYENLIAWMAHNVQLPGKKIRWVPLIKGCPGDGKSLITAVMTAAMGYRNVYSVGPEIIANGGGFTDWAHGHAVAALEEMYLTGRDRYRIANAVKQFISNNVVTINPKGGKPKKVLNTCNHVGYTNHPDAVPLEDEDRRWFIIFTPYATRPAMWQQLGVDKQGAKAHFDSMFDSMEREPDQWRKWLLDYPIPEWFDADGQAMETDEKAVMSASGSDDTEMITRELIEDGTYGVTPTVLSSACLTRALQARLLSEGLEAPKTMALNHLLTRLGFAQLPKVIKWDSRTHRVWHKPGVDTGNDAIRAELDRKRL